MESHGGMILTGKIEEFGEIPVPMLISITHSTWIDHGANPGLRSERLASNRLSHGTASIQGKDTFFSSVI
jgi:hypothetical protein